MYNNSGKPIYPILYDHARYTSYKARYILVQKLQKEWYLRTLTKCTRARQIKINEKNYNEECLKTENLARTNIFLEVSSFGMVRTLCRNTNF